jgi:hypothetical protein
VEKSRAIFARMFEAGAQNRVALRMLMTPPELAQLRAAVMTTIRSVTHRGACERVQALQGMPALTDCFSPRVLPLTAAPTLVLFAEREEAVLDARAPTRFALETAHRAYFPDSSVRRVAVLPGRAPVQHASLIFHVFEFRQHLGSFYARLRRSKLRFAA